MGEADRENSHSACLKGNMKTNYLQTFHTYTKKGIYLDLNYSQTPDVGKLKSNARCEMFSLVVSQLCP